MTPLAMSMILHFYASPEPYRNMEMEPQQFAIDSFINDGVLVEFGTNDKKYNLTEKGHAWVDMILKTPYPERIWIDPRDSKQAYPITK